MSSGCFQEAVRLLNNYKVSCGPVVVQKGIKRVKKNESNAGIES